MTEFPAVLIGGPPHSGKSVLVYSLTTGLRRRGVAHYVLRASPDGEGDFSNEADQSLIRTLRRKGAFTSEFSERVSGQLARRHLPLLVDVGGRPTEEQLKVFRHCTHAILLIGDRDEAPRRYALDRAIWRAIMDDVGVPIIADLKSALRDRDDLLTTEPMITGTISGLERGNTAEGPVMDALLDRLEAVLGIPDNRLSATHRAIAPASAHYIDLPILTRQLGSIDGRWRPEQLPFLSEVLPSGAPLAVYGRAPNWVYATLAWQAAPSPIYHFDARFGWLSPPRLPVDTGSVPSQQAGWRTEVSRMPDYDLLELITTSQYLDPDEPKGLPLPRFEGTLGLILSGKVPNWVLLAAVRQLGRGKPWLAVYQPQLAGAVVVASVSPLPVGSVLSIKPE